MDHCVLMIADLTIVATSHDKDSELGPAFWDVRISDTLTGKQKRVSWDSTQFGHIMAACLIGEDCPQNVREYLYGQCEPLLIGWDVEVRPIP